MNKQTKMKKILLILIVAVGLCLVGAFAVVSNQPADVEDKDSNLQEIIKGSKTWDVAFPEWSGRALPDFEVKGLDGVTHRLSDYKGKNVLVVFWATWCPACVVEIPHLIKLRNLFTEDELVILAVSTETPAHLKNFVASNEINYSVVPLGQSVLPEPFGKVTSIPTNFFIDENGNLKLAALGLVSLEDSKMILKAKL